MFEIKNQGNLRLLSGNQIGLDFDWISEYRKLRFLISENPKLDIYGNEFFIYFSQLPWEIALEDQDSIIGVPVIGYDNDFFPDDSFSPDEEDMYAELIDLDKSEVFGLQDLVKIEAFNRNTREKVFEDAENHFKDSGVELESGWRLAIKTNFQKGNNKEIVNPGLIDIQFYANI